MIKVLWIDDEYTPNDTLIAVGLEEGIKIEGFDNTDEGLAKLEEDLNYFDAVILDAYTNKRKSDPVPALEGFYEAQKRIFQLSVKRQIPCFIYTGNAVIKKQDPQNLPFPKFVKGVRPEEFCKAIKEAVANQPSDQLRSKHKKVFSLFTPAYLGEKPERYLLDCLLQLDDISVGRNIENEDYLNRLRKIVEALFHTLYKKSLLPEPLVKGSLLQLNEACKFMSGEKYDDGNFSYSLAEEARFPKVINNSIFYLIHRTNFGSHYNEIFQSAGIENRNIGVLQGYDISPYLLHSLTYQLMDVLFWFKAYIDHYSNIEVNKQLITKAPLSQELMPKPRQALPIIVGPLEHNGKYFHVQNCSILPTIVKDQGWKKGDIIEIDNYKESTQDSGFLYFCGSYRK